MNNTETLKNQEIIEHNVPTNTKGKVMCLSPIEIVNPQLVDFILTNDEVYYFDCCGFNTYKLPHLRANCTTKQLKKYLLKSLRYLVRHSTVHTFFNGDGVSLDAKIQVPCGHCLLCTERKKNSFAARCAMECQSHDHLPLFVTLTYRDEDLPDGLKYSDVQYFLKRLRIGLKRDGFDVNLRFAGCGEYGTKRQRPHYHLLIWGFPRTGKFKYIFEIDEFIRSKWKHGITETKYCFNTQAGYYVGKYMVKSAYVKSTLPDPIHYTSKNLGVDFVMKTASKTLHDNPAQTKILYLNKFDGTVNTLPLVKYYIQKIFPTFTSIPVEYRNAIRDIKLAVIPDYFKDQMDFDIELTHNYVEDGCFDTTIDLLKLNESIDVLRRYSYKHLPDIDLNQKCKDMYYIHLFDNLGDVDLQHKAYMIEKQQAVARDKEVF